MHRLLQSAGFLLLSATAVPAQQIPREFESWSPPAANQPQGPGALRLRSVQVPRRDYRYEGLALGGIAFGALGAWVGSQITEACPAEPGIDCGPDRLGNALAVGIAAAALGGGLGYVVGRLSSKPDPAPAGGAGP